jgi:hypothetical protein
LDAPQNAGGSLLAQDFLQAAAQIGVGIVKD